MARVSGGLRRNRPSQYAAQHSTTLPGLRVFIGESDERGAMTFEEFADMRLPAVLRFAGVLTGDRALAEDVVQEVLIRAHARWRKIGRLDHPESYIRKMIVNEFISSKRRTWRFIPAGSLPTGTRPDIADQHTADHAAHHAERAALLAEIGKLPRRQRAVLVLRYYEGLSDPEIATVLGCAAGTVRGYASRALATLRVEMRAPANAPAPAKETR
jgi:RNA polymerase sigma-70 factor (sigma-E family)